MSDLAIPGSRPLGLPAAPAATAARSASGFGATLGRALADVNRLQADAQAAATALAAGEGSLAETVVAVQKADIAFQLTLQIRNKLLEAYQEVMRMQV